jgi:hypothetical protein
MDGSKTEHRCFEMEHGWFETEQLTTTADRRSLRGGRCGTFQVGFELGKQIGAALAPVAEGKAAEALRGGLLSD